MKKIFPLLVICSIFFGLNVLAQPGFDKMQAAAEKAIEGGNTPSFRLTINPKNSTLGSLLIDKDVSISQSQALQWISSQLALRPGSDDLVASTNPVHYPGIDVLKFHQYYKGIKVEHGMINLGLINGRLAVGQLEFYSIPDNFNIVPQLSEDAALQKAVQYINAAQYSWEANPSVQKPAGEMVILKDYLNSKDVVCLAYKFTIIASQPYSSNTIYINASNGAVPLSSNNMKNFNGTGDGSMASGHALVKSKPAVVNNFVENKTATGNNPAYANIAISAPTIFSGSQTIYTDFTPGPAKPYLLQQETADGTVITVYDYHGGEPSGANDLLATVVADDDNNWAGTDVSATEIFFNMQVITDYWKTVHGRISWDNANGPLNNYVHTNQGNNAGWNDGMYYGDGVGAVGPHVSLDIAAHELGHAVNQSIIGGAGFVEGREPGTLNEGFADIWGTCIENYGVNKFSSSLQNKEVWLMAEEVYPNGGFSNTRGLRNTINPKMKENPDTYYGTNYAKSNFDDCPAFVPAPNGNDACGVHRNLSILSKWFSLMSIGGTGINDHNYNYTVGALGIKLADSIAYNTLLLLTPNSDYTSTMHASINMVNSMYNASRPTIAPIVAAAWRAVGLLDTAYFGNTTNPAVFGLINNSFTAIAVGKGGHVWAGTSGKGLYKYNGIEWKKCDFDATLLNKINYRDFKTDKKGGIWMAQTGYSGVSGSTNSSGGVYYFNDSTFASRRYYSSSPIQYKPNVISRNVTSILVDTFRTNEKALMRGKELPQVWAVSMSQTTASVNTSGGVAMGLTDTITLAPDCCQTVTYDSNFVKVATVHMANYDFHTQARGSQTVGGGAHEVWVYSAANSEASLLSWGFGPNYYNGSPAQIIRYDAGTGDSLGAINSLNNSNFDANFTAKAIYFDKDENKWIGLLNKSVLVQDNAGVWHNLNNLALPNEIFPVGIVVNNNAISGDKNGNVFIGTNQGLVVYTPDASLAGVSPLDNLNSYKRYTTKDGLPDNTVRAIAIDTLRKGIWLATDNGMILWRFRGPERLISVTKIKRECPGNVLKYRLTATGSYNTSSPANNLIVELSNSVGDFTSPLVLSTGLVINDYDNVESYALPYLPNGTNYRLRARSTNPVIIGSLSRPISIQASINSLPSNGIKTLLANRECLDPNGWTNYFYDNHTADETDDTLLLSLKKNGNAIGTIGDGTFEVKVASTILAGGNMAPSITNPLLTTQFVSMNRYWHVTPTVQPTSNVGVRFYYNGQDLRDVNGTVPYGPINHTALVFYKTDGDPDPTTNFAGATTILSYTNAAAPALDKWKYTQIEADIHQSEILVNHFSGGGGGSTPGGVPLVTLPVQLLSFNANLVNKKTRLQWATSAEINTRAFEIERSTDGRSFTTMLSVPAAGNSNGQRNYTAIDEHTAPGRNYYRLKMIDIDGRTTYSSVRLITLNAQNYIAIYPSPAKNSISIEGDFEGKTLSIAVLDITGRVLAQYQRTYNTVVQVPVNSLASGTYILQVQDGQQTMNRRFVKE